MCIRDRVKGHALPYVSRGGLKLEKAMKEFDVELADKVCKDVGSSTGGFTDCMLQNGARKVFAIDVGRGPVSYTHLDVYKRQLETLPYEYIRWIENEEIDMDRLTGTSDMKKIKDLKGRPLLLFVHEWSIRMTLERNEGLRLSEFGRS